MVFGLRKIFAAALMVGLAGHAAGQASREKASPEVAALLAEAPDAGDVTTIGKPWVQPVADAVMASGSSAATGRNAGFSMELAGMQAAWLTTANGKDLAFVKQAVDKVVAADGSMRDGNGDTLQLGRQILLLYRIYGTAKYFKAAQTIYAQVNAMRSDASHAEEAISMASFAAEYASVFRDPKEFAEIAKDFALAQAGVKHAAEAHSSKNSMGPQAAAAFVMVQLVDAIPYFPAGLPERTKLIAMLNVLAKTTRPDESNSLQLSYALLKGVRLGYLPVSYQQAGELEFAHAEKPSADGPNVENVGAYLLAASEMEVVTESLSGRGKTVMVDAWFNSQKQKDVTGAMVYYHYKWDDMANSGFSLLGRLFEDRGMATDTLYTAPTVKDLAKASIYIIASPDIPSKNPIPNYMQAADADAIAAWVKAGGVLLLMENDGNNSEFTHFNLLAQKFGIYFNPVDRNTVPGNPPVMELGELNIPADSVFAYPHVGFVKEICTLTLSGDAKPVYTDLGDVLIATAKYGKGTVIAMPDPWFYNEYTDGRKPPPPFNNFAVADDLVHWLVGQIPAARTGIRTATAGTRTATGAAQHEEKAKR